MTDEEMVAAESDPDNSPLTDEELTRVRLVRRACSDKLVASPGQAM